MSNTTVFKDLQTRCAQAGTNLRKACIEANVDRSIVERWKTKTPKSFEIYNKLTAAIDKLSKENWGQ